MKMEQILSDFVGSRFYASLASSSDIVFSYLGGSHLYGLDNGDYDIVLVGNNPVQLEARVYPCYSYRYKEGAGAHLDTFMINAHVYFYPLPAFIRLFNFAGWGFDNDTFLLSSGASHQTVSDFIQGERKNVAKAAMSLICKYHGSEIEQWNDIGTLGGKDAWRMCLIYERYYATSLDVDFLTKARKFGLLSDEEKVRFEKEAKGILEHKDELLSFDGETYFKNLQETVNAKLEAAE
jgi:hypothetical protein